MKIRGHDLNLTEAHDRLMAQLPEFWKLVIQIWPPSSLVIIGIDVAKQGPDQSCVMVNHERTSKCKISGFHDYRFCAEKGSYMQAPGSSPHSL